MLGEEVKERAVGRLRLLDKKHVAAALDHSELCPRNSCSEPVRVLGWDQTVVRAREHEGGNREARECIEHIEARDARQPARNLFGRVRERPFGLDVEISRHRCLSFNESGWNSTSKAGAQRLGARVLRRALDHRPRDLGRGATALFPPKVEQQTVSERRRLG